MSGRLAGWFPGWVSLRAYQVGWLRGDLQAGLSVAAYLIPQAMAYAALAGLSPVVGLWTALPPLAIYAVVGSSRQLSVGPESTTALMTVSVVAPLTVAAGAASYASYAAVLAVLVGAMCLVAGLLKMGFLASLLSKPVLVGYLTGVAAAMIVAQLGRLTGISVKEHTTASQMMSVVHGLSHIHWPTAGLGFGALVAVAVMGRWLPRVPGPLVCVVLSATVVATFSLAQRRVDVVGSVPATLPVPQFPDVTSTMLSELALPAIGIAVVAFSDTILTARAFAIRAGAEVDANAELRAVGLSNLAVGLTRGFPVSSSGSRTALGAAAGSRTQVYSLVTLIVVAGAVLFGGTVIAYIPEAVLGALVIYAAAKLVDIAEFRRLARFRRSELVLALVTAVCVPVFGVLYAVLAAVALTILDLLRRLSRAHDSVQGFVPGVPGMHDVDDYPTASVLPGLVVYRYDAPLCFANAEDFRRRALACIDQSSQPVAWFVLNAEANVEVDITALDALEQLRAECDRRGVVFAIARLKQDLRDALDSVGLVDKIGKDRLFMTLPTAVDAYRTSTKGGGAQ